MREEQKRDGEEGGIGRGGVGGRRDGRGGERREHFIQVASSNMNDKDCSHGTGWARRSLLSFPACEHTVG